MRVKAQGGSTMHWGAWSLRFKPEDFNLYTNTGKGADWPFGYDELECYYQKAEEYLSVCGDASEQWSYRSESYPMPPFEWSAADGEMIQAFDKLGIKPGKMPIARYRKCMTTGTCKYCPIGGRFNAQYVLDDLIKNTKYCNFEIRANTVARQICVASKARVESIDCLHTISGDSYSVYGDNAILCAGAYEVPKLLSNSKSQYWKNGIGNDHDLLGRHVISHSMLEVTGTINKNPHGWFQEYDFPTLMSRTYDTEEYQNKGKIFIFKNRALPNIDIAQLMIEGKTKSEIHALVTGPMKMQLQAFMEEKGKFTNQLRIGSGYDRFGLPKTVVDFNRTSEENANAQEHLKQRMEPVLKAMGYKVTKSVVRDPGGHHTTGTCRMSVKPEDGIVDQNLKVHGMDNLYICSNGAFPSGSAVNPTLTLTALAFRLSNFLNKK